MYRGAPNSLQRTHVAFFSLQFSAERPKDVDAISLLDVQPLPVEIMAKLAGSATLAHVQRSVALGYMVVVMANEKLDAMTMEMQFPGSTDAYTSGEKKVEENWKVYVKLAASDVFAKME